MQAGAHYTCISEASVAAAGNQDCYCRSFAIPPCNYDGIVLPSPIAFAFGWLLLRLTVSRLGTTDATSFNGRLLGGVETTGCQHG